MAFKRSDWNDLVRSVNEILQNPPPDTDCDPLPALEEVGEKHRWSKADIQAMQDALKATCPDISFSPIPQLWKQSILDEINEAIGQAWCNCEDDNDCTPEKIASEHGMEFFLYNNGPPRVISSCLGNDTPDIPLSSFINGMQVGQPNIYDRVWRVQRRNHYNDGHMSTSSPLAVGIVSCQGIVTYTGPAGVSTVAGSLVFCDCSDFCMEHIANLQAMIPNIPSQFYSTYHLILDSSGASCRVPGDACP
jgi:hypothetical protein